MRVHINSCFTLHMIFFVTVFSAVNQGIAAYSKLLAWIVKLGDTGISAWADTGCRVISRVKFYGGWNCI